MARIFAARLSSERPSTEALAALRLSARTPRMEGGLAGGAGSGGAKVMIVSSSAWLGVELGLELVWGLGLGLYGRGRVGAGVRGQGWG